METKLIAAEIATAAGVTTIISSSKYPERIFEIIEYNNHFRSTNPSTPREPLSGRESPVPDFSKHENMNELRERAAVLHSLPISRPPHTLFTPSLTPLRDLKSWTSHTLTPSGNVIIDSGAHTVLARRDSGGRLLAAGVLGVKGTFASGQAVRIVIRKRRDGTSSLDDANTTVTAVKVSTVATSTTYANGSPITTEPNTPNLLPIASMTSSITTLELAPSMSSSEPTPPVSASSSKGPTQTMLWEDDKLHEKEEEDATDDEWELFEVGRGLANYNSAQISRVKGMKRYDSITR